MESQKNEKEDADIKWTHQETSDPFDIEDMPQEYFDDADVKDKNHMNDKEELAYLRNVAATFFNYRVMIV